MTEYPAIADPDRCPPHPGEVIEDIIADLDKSKSELAVLLGIRASSSTPFWPAASPLSPAIAAKVGKLFGNGPALWLRMQASHDAWHAEREVDVSDVPTLDAA